MHKTRNYTKDNGFITGCQGNKHGQSCSRDCGFCRDNQSCDPIDGSCQHGCEKGYQGVNCDKGK